MTFSELKAAFEREVKRSQELERLLKLEREKKSKPIPTQVLSLFLEGE